VGLGKKVTKDTVETGFLILLIKGAREKVKHCNMNFPLAFHRESYSYSEWNLALYPVG
jgi:hypothetical protein